MRADIENRSNIRFPFHYRELARRVIAEALFWERFPHEAEVSLLIVDDEKIREINSSTRGIDAATDVLSFPMLEFDAPGICRDPMSHDTNPESGHVFLGDIVICAQRVREQAALYGHTQRREYAFLVAHGMLHLLGYDHICKEDDEKMRERQRAILEKMGVKRN